jgi:hypothetical protein
MRALWIAALLPLASAAQASRAPNEACHRFAALAASYAEARDAGLPLTDALSISNSSDVLAIRDLTRRMAAGIYASPHITPAVAYQTLRDACEANPKLAPQSQEPKDEALP